MEAALAHGSADYLYMLLFLTLFVEGTGLPGIPFEAVFLALGLLMAKGKAEYWPAVFFGASGNLLGNLAGYFLGMYPGRRLLPRLERWFNLRPEVWREIEGWLDRYGAPLIIFSRWVAIFRTPVIIGAGMVRMNLFWYALFSALGALSWTAAWQLAAWKTGDLAFGWWDRNGLGVLALLQQHPWPAAAVLALLGAGGYYGARTAIHWWRQCVRLP